MMILAIVMMVMTDGDGDCGDDGGVEDDDDDGVEDDDDDSVQDDDDIGDVDDVMMMTMWKMMG